MKKKNLNKKLKLKAISVSNLSELQGGLAAGTHEPCQVYEWTDWCTMFGCPPLKDLS